MKQTYKGHTLEVKRVGGSNAAPRLHYSITRKEDGKAMKDFEQVSPWAIVRDEFCYLEEDVDDLLRHQP